MGLEGVGSPIVLFREAHALNPHFLHRMDVMNITKPQKIIPPRQLVWVRAKGKLNPDPALHMCVLAHASDHYLVNTALLAHGITFNTQPRLKILGERPRKGGDLLRNLAG